MAIKNAEAQTEQHFFSFMAPAGDEEPTVESAVQSLRQKIGCITTARPSDGLVFSTGSAAIDSRLPIGGLHPATLTEWIAAHGSAAAGSLSLIAAAQRLRQIPDQPLVVVDCDGTFYPPAAAALGIPIERMVLLRPSSGADALWAIDQSLRSAAVAGVWADLPMQIDDRDARRLQLAAESGRTPGLLVRRFQARGKPSFAEVQFYVTTRKRSPIPRPATSQNTAVHRSRSVDSRGYVAARGDFETHRVTLDRVRGGVSGQTIDVRIDDCSNLSVSPTHSKRPHETAAGNLASQLADPTTVQPVAARRSAARRQRNAS